MNCPKCQTLNESGAQFCRNCGCNLLVEPQQNTENSRRSDLYILVFLIIIGLSELIGFAVQGLIENWYEDDTAKSIMAVVKIIAGISTILLGLSIKNSIGKVFGIILASLWAIYCVYLNLVWIL